MRANITKCAAVSPFFNSGSNRVLTDTAQPLLLFVNAGHGVLYWFVCKNARAREYLYNPHLMRLNN